MRLSFDTSKVGPADRAGFWREVVCSVYVPMNAEPLQRHAFHGRMEARAAFGRTYSEIDAGPQRVARDAGQIAAAGARDIFTFVFQREGSCSVEQAGNSALLLPGDMLVFHNSRPYRLLFPQPFRQTVIQVPREALGRQADSIDRQLGQRIAPATGFGSLVRSYAGGLAENACALDDAELCVLLDELFHLLAARGEASRAGLEGSERIERSLVWRAQRYARELIADPELSVETISRAQRISTRTLQRAFTAHGTSVMRWLREERLALCARALLDPSQNARSIAEIAARSGFRDVPAFCRSFRARYGCTPGHWRRRARRGE